MASVKEQLERLKARANSMKEKATETMGQVLQTAEIGGTAFVFGYLRGRMGDDNGDLVVAGVPVGLGTGILLHLAGFAGLFGKHDEHAHNLGDGAVSEYLAVLAMRMGAESNDQFKGKRRIAGQPQARNLNGGSPFGGAQQARYNYQWAR